MVGQRFEDLSFLLVLPDLLRALQVGFCFIGPRIGLRQPKLHPDSVDLNAIAVGVWLQGIGALLDVVCEVGHGAIVENLPFQNVPVGGACNAIEDSEDFVLDLANRVVGPADGNILVRPDAEVEYVEGVEGVSGRDMVDRGVEFVPQSRIVSHWNADVIGGSEKSSERSAVQFLTWV